MILEKHLNLTEPEASIIRWQMGMYDQEGEGYSESVINICPETILFQHADHEVSKILGI